LYSSLSIIRMIKSRRMRWAGHVARMGLKKTGYRIFVGKPEGKKPLVRPRRRWILKKSDGVLWAGFICLRTGISGHLSTW
jgi:hypothetical protein